MVTCLNEIRTYHTTWYMVEGVRTKTDYVSDLKWYSLLTSPLEYLAVSYGIGTCFIWYADVPYGTGYVPHACPRGAGPWTGYIGAERSSCEVACPPP